jgi:hypothetical protein
MFAQTGIPAGAAAPKSAPRPATVQSSSVYTPLAAPARLVNGVPISPGSPLNVVVAGGSTGVPANAQSVVVNLASAFNVDAGYLQAFPTGGSTSAAALNQYYANQLQSELATVPVGTGGQITIATHVATSLFVDEQGYYAAPVSGTAGQYQALPPARLTDTRTAGGTPLASGGTLRIQVTGAGGVPAAGVSAAVVNIAALDDPNAGFLQAYPNTRPTSPQTANVNYNGNSIHSANLPCPPAASSTTSGCDITSNRAIVSLDTTGGFTIFANQGPVDVVVDVTGYFTNAAASTGQFFTPTGVSRLFDSRIGGNTLAARATRNLPVAGAGGSNPVIPSGASAAVLSVAIDKTLPNNSAHPFSTGPGAGFLTVFPGPTGSSRPLAADANFAANSIVSSHVYATLGSDGSINIYNGSDAAIDVIVDAYGFFSNIAAAPTPFTVTMSPSTSVATGANTTITATVRDASSAVVANDNVVFTTSGGASCGTLSPTSATTNASGVASTQYTASSTAGPCTVTGTESIHGASGTTTITQTGAGNQAYQVSCSPTSAHPSTAATTATQTQGNLTCSATGLPVNATVDLALFPSQGTNAPVNSGGAWTFTPTAGNEAAGIGTTNNGAAGNGAFIETVNGTAQGTNAAGNTNTQVNGINTGPSGSISFVVNSFDTDGAYAAVWTNTDLDNNLGLDPTTHQPNQPFGISQALSWTPTAAPTGTNGTFFVQSVDHTAGTFVGCTGSDDESPTAGCLTFIYSNTGAQAGSSYCYNGAGTSFTGSSSCTFAGAGEFGISFAQFDSWLSGATPATPASTQPAGSPGNPLVPGDTINVASYNAAGPSEFGFLDDAPGATSGLTTTSPSAGTAHLNWTGPTNPDVANDTDNTAGYNIWRMQTAGTSAGGACAAVGTWQLVTTTVATGGTAPGTTYTDSSACLAGGGTFSYAVAAMANNPNDNETGPNSNTSSVTVTSVAPAAALPPVSTSSVLTQGAVCPTDPQHCALISGDTLSFIFQTDDVSGTNVSATNPITVSPTASFQFADNFGERSTVTCGTNATCSISNGGTQLNIVLTANPHQDNVATASSGSPTPSLLNTSQIVSVVSATGVSGPAGPWNLAFSGLNYTSFGFATHYPTLTRQFDGTSTTGNTVDQNSTYSCCSGSNPPTDNPPSAFHQSITPTVPNTIVLGAGDFTAPCCDGGANTGDPVTVYNSTGVAIGTGTYNNTSGTTITTTTNFNNGDELYLVYQDTSGNHDPADSGPSNQPSLTQLFGVDNFVFTPTPIATTGSLGNSQNVTVTLSGVTPNGTVYLDFSNVGGSATVNGTPLTATPAAFTADGAGNIQIIYTSSPTATSTTSGSDTIEVCSAAGFSGACESDSYNYAAQTVSNTSSTLVAAPTSLPADGTSATNVTVTVIDQNGSPVSGYTVTLSNNGTSHASIVGANPAVTNASGQASWTATDLTAETVTFHASGPVLNGTALSINSNPVTFHPTAATAGNSSITHDIPPSDGPPPVASDGSSLVQLTATFQDVNNNPRAGDAVTISASNAGLVCLSESDATGLSTCATSESTTLDPNGKVVVWGKDATAQTVTFTATDTGSGNLATTDSVNFSASHVALNSVNLTNSTHSGISTYVVNFTTAAALNSTTSGANTIVLAAPCNTTFPTSVGGAYTVTDTTHPAFVETITAVTLRVGHTPANWSGTACGTHNEVGISFTANGGEGATDVWTVSVTNVTNTDRTQSGSNTGAELFMMWTNVDNATVTRYNAFSIT